MNFWLTTGDVDDRNPVSQLVQNLKGWLFADKGYISNTLWEELKNKGLELCTRVRKNMKERILESAQEFLLSKRGIIESVIVQLKSILHIQHTRHRSVLNFQVNILAGLIAYTFKPKKPTVGFQELNHLDPFTALLTPN